MQEEAVLRRFFTFLVIALTLCGLAASPAIAQGGGSDDDGPSLDEPSGGGGAPKKLKGYEKTVDLAVDDIREYWADEFSELYPDTDYEEIADDEIFPMSPGADGPSCGGQELGYSEVEGNAQYARCGTGEKFIWWDDEGLFPQFFRDYGDYSIALVLAHEWGHAIQDQAGNLGPQYPTILSELQADCFAGAWTLRVREGDSEVTLKGGELDSALSALLQVADPVGNDPDSEGAHGNAFDRVTAFQDGIEGGATGCVGYYDPATPPTITEIPFTDEQDAASGGNVDAELVIPISIDLLNDFYTQVAPEVYQELQGDDVVEYDSQGSKSQLPTCGGTTPARKVLTNRVFYCLDDGYIGFDQPYLQQVYENIGDFGVATLFANAWATYVQTLQDFPGVADNADNAVLGADCYTGGFAAAMYNELLSSDEISGQDELIIFSPGDLDETIQAFIDYTKARGVESNLDITFLRVTTFKNGFRNGYQSCSQFAEEDTSVLDGASG
jgi:hypothetical protein